MINALSYVFVQNALIGAFFTSIICGIIGTLVVTNRMVFVAGGIAHSVYGGVGIAAFFGLPILVGATGFSVFCAAILAYMLLYAKERLDALIGSLWAFGMALGVILVELTPGYSKDFMGYLFGSILSITQNDIAVMAGFSSFLLVFMVLNYRVILGLSYDNEFTQLQGINTRFFGVMLMVLIAIGVVISMRSVGIILIIALLSIPAYCSEIFTASLAKMMFLASAISFIAMFSGIAIAYYYDLQAGASIVIVLALFSFMLAFYHHFLSPKIQFA
ncbi:metal ABC transporter permease [Helicobacter turcicus]|uniref:Metal ABC transporter permease n=1 Tax=Helicobacter turcicus TaxID=2867412 RepID=A0ABS7JL36_9HELI|nr:metal ABC transporter permease [Helicobacter turcicus]MBX7490114.1 metal ABC transporter permease [Helicobacter turcicus]MBX7544973.1 metal ABC transporter permease [Helicobacter turcicus]